MWVEPMRMLSAGMRGHLLVNAGAQDGGEPEQVELHDSHFGFALLEDHGAGV